MLASESLADFEESEPFEEEMFCDEEVATFEAPLSFFWFSGFRESAGALDWPLPSWSLAWSFESAGAGAGEPRESQERS